MGIVQSVPCLASLPTPYFTLQLLEADALQNPRHPGGALVALVQKAGLVAHESE